jgi:hypothetical protein
VFFVYDDGQHGLIAATADQSTAMRWNVGSDIHTMAFANGMGAGKANTVIIVTSQGFGDGDTHAARICNEYSVTIGGVQYGDWYLPSKYELNLLYLQRTVVGGFANYWYWSSSEATIGTSAWSQNFGDGSIYEYWAKWATYCVRAIRAF